MYEELRKFTEQVLAACEQDPGGDWVQACVDEFRDRFPAMSSVDHVRLRVMPEGVVAPMEVGPGLRDWLAVHAPPEPLWHFEVPMDRPCPERGGVTLSRDEAIAARQEFIVWDKERSGRRRAMWPWVWADAVLAERGKA